jgi:beta-exotoxin I transport system permease protein
MLANVFTKTTRDWWKAMAIAAGTLGVLFFMGMSVYKDIDLSVYTNLPEAFRSLFGIPENADVGALAYGAIYSGYGALTLAAVVLVLGAASIAGEERKGTLGLLLANPKSRTSILVSKAGALILVTALGALLLWAVGRAAPAIFDVSVSGIHVEELVIAMSVNALFYGALALAVGGWTGKRGLASGVSAGVMALSFVAVGLLPLIGSLEGLTKAFPWYYFTASNPHLNGINWAHLSVLLTGIVVFAAVAVVGVNRRDLRSQSVGVTLTDRLRANPLTRRAADLVAGTARVSSIWMKTFSEYQGLVLIDAALMFAFMGLMIGPMYNFIDEALISMQASFPEELLALFGGGDMSTPEGFYQIETFGLMAPIAVMVVTVAIGGRALAAEEANRTMGLLLANPIGRSTVLLEKTAAMVLGAFVVGIATFAGVVGGSWIGGLGMSVINIAATTLLVTLLGLLFGTLALALGAATGRVAAAIWGAVALAFVFFLIDGLLPFTETLAGWARISPFYYYLSSDPLLNGMHWGHAAVLAGLTVVFVAVAVPLFQRRDLRQTG